MVSATFFIVCRLVYGGAEKEAGGTAASFRGSNASYLPLTMRLNPRWYFVFSFAKIKFKRK